ncbi:MAG TPA: hypothetical protein DCY64_16295 [Hydrogenophaga sp.]|nr:MAG: hypothetical protein A2X73_05570 [Burkholderiales bacterium GWE1_65_30]OGA92805.1 MAG: hypothetical protein A2X72_22955 [Burkholderiales bacterium GWF1_66_17]HAX21824.1 hypothetical protein [Hydrogenophaga sp.]HBU20788.1 hypothetical protein [Hydrogenophaga sp.]
MPEAPEPPELTELPESAELKMPKPGQAAVPQVSCVQKGNMDITRPSLPLLSCWESAASEGGSVSELQKACLVQMTPMKVDSALVPKCPSKALGGLHRCPKWQGKLEQPLPLHTATVV